MGFFSKISKFFGGAGSDSSVVEEKEKALKLLTAENEELKKKLANASGSDNPSGDLKKKYEKLLSEANAKIAELDKQLKSSLECKVDDSFKKQLAEVEKLKKKIKDLEEETEDLEDDLASANKKLKNKEGECNELNNQLSAEKKAYAKLKEDLKKATEELEEKSSELSLKGESILFVQEVLSAKVVSDANVKALHSRIDGIKNFVLGEMRDTIKQYFTLNDEHERAYFGADLKKWAITSKKSWIQNKTTIAFVGEFSAGKTSIVNRILSQDDPSVPRLPVSTKATTAIPTYISGGVSTAYNFVTPANVQKNISEATFKRVNKEVLDQVKGVSSLIQYFVMTYKNPNLNNLSILDTPGFNSNDKEDAERTIEVINECDALFWVFDVNAGTVNRSSIQLIKQNLKKPLYVVINKVDSKATSEVDKVEQLIKKTLQDEGVAVKQYVRFSSKANLNDIMAPIKSVPQDKGNEQYEQTLRDLMESLVQTSEKSVKKYNEESNNAFKYCDQLAEQYNSEIQSLNNSCQAAAAVPHWETHIFSSDRYEMSSYEYGKLAGHLDDICGTHMDQLCNLYDQQMEAQRIAQQAWANFNDAKHQLVSIENMRDLLNKHLKRN